MSNTFPSVPALTLKTDITSTDSTFKLRSIKWYTGSDGTDVNLSASDFGTTGYGVFEPRTSRQEFFTWTTSTIGNYATTGITIASRGLPWGSDYSTEAAARKFAHPSGSTVLLFTDAPALWNTFANKENTETISAVWTFANTAFPRLDTYLAPTNNEDFAPKKYIDDTAIAGAPAGTSVTAGLVKTASAALINAGTGDDGTYEYVIGVNDVTVASGGAGDANKLPVLDADGKLDQSFIDLTDNYTWTGTQTHTGAIYVPTPTDDGGLAVNMAVAEQNAAYGTSGEAYSAGDALYVKAADGKLYKTDASGDESTFKFVGFAVNAATGADESVRYARPGGIITGMSGLTTGSYYYIDSATAGGVSVVPDSTRVARVGQALSTTELKIVEPKYMRRGSQACIAATTYAQTTGFFPTRIEVRAASTQSAGGMSIGDDGNTCAYIEALGATAHGGVIDKAWYIYDANGAQVENSGTVTAKTQTGFTLNCDTHVTNATVQWTAYSE